LVTDRSAPSAAQPAKASSGALAAAAGEPRTSAATSRDAKPGGAGSLTGWLTRPFRAGDDADQELLATQQSTQPRSGAPVRLPAVTGVARPFASNAPAGSTAHASLAVGTFNSPTTGNAARDFPGRVSPTTAYQSAGGPTQPRLLPQVNEPATAWSVAGESYPTSASGESANNPLARPKIIFNPVAGMNGNGQAMLKPRVQVAHGDEIGDSYPAMRFAQLPGDSLPPPQEYGPQEVPEGPVEGPVEGPQDPVVGIEGGEEIPLGPGPDMWVPMEPVYEGPMTAHEAVGPFRECFYTVLANLNGPRSCPPGIGVENVMNAPFWLDTTQPLQNCRIRADGASDWEFPDRIEYFWAQTPGPKGAQQLEFGDDGGEPSVDYQEVSFYIERGGERLSVGTELPIRAVDPDVRRNTTGFADMRVTTKAVLLDGKDWQLTQVMHTHIPTGSFRRGTGNGHVSLEPGVAWRYKWSDVTYIHGDLTYWFPIAADPFHSGQMFNYGIGISHIWIDGDKWAIMPTLELNAWTILDGQQTFPGEEFPLVGGFDPGGPNQIDTLSILNIHPGLRWVCDTSGDCGVREFGITSGIAVTEDHWYEEILRIELRWVF
jgi:hypothetical protein